MKTKIFGVLLIAALSGFVTTGCVETVDGRSEAGVPFIKDTVQGSYERSVPQVLDAARAVLKYNGQLTVDNSINDSLEAKIHQTSIFIRVVAVDPNKPITRVMVQTRTRTGVSDIDLAHEIEKEIALQLVR